MPFTTKLDYSNNRQIKQYSATKTVLSGGTSFGVPFSALTTGPNLLTSGITQTFNTLTYSFSGNNTTTVYNWPNSNMSVAQFKLSAITPSNSATTQQTGQVYLSSSTTTVDGNIVVTSYTGVSFDTTVTGMTNLGGGNYSGTVLTQTLDIIYAGALDYSGRTIWVDTSGITRTQDLIITKNPQIGYVWTCYDSEGKGEWSVGGGSGSTIYSADGSISGTRMISTDGDIIWRKSTGTGNFKMLIWNDQDSTQASLYFKCEDNGPIPPTNNFAYAKFGIVFSGDSDIYGTGDLLMCMNGTLNSSSATTNDVALRISSDKSIIISSGLTLQTVGAGPSTIDIGVNASGLIVNVASDISLKENVETITSALDKVKQLRGVSFNWIDRLNGGDQKKIGFIAQEIEPIVPELVYTHTDGIKTVHYKDITALLVEAVKELSNEEVIIKNKLIETQTIIAEDNNIDLNYNGTKETSIGGGLRVLNALSGNTPAELKLNSDGNWITNNDLIPSSLTIPEFTPISSNDSNGNVGNITRDTNYLYVKVSDNKWKRINLEDF